MRPRIVCLCGSTKFKTAFEQANYDETMAGKIVLSVGFYGHASGEVLTPERKLALDDLHLQKIELADEILVINVGGYVGASTKREIWYAVYQAKRVRWLEPVSQPALDLALSWFTDYDQWKQAGIEAAQR